MKVNSEMSPVTLLAVEKAGGLSQLARDLGISRQAVFQWKLIPWQHVLNIEKLTGLPRTLLRPDIYPD